jgi:GT2 family glycosyltransferase
MLVSIETPVFKGGWLRQCIDSVLYQSSPHWRFSLLWDGGDDPSRRILEELEQRSHPNVTVYFAENQGIARARRFLTERSRGEFVLPLDDDDVLPFHAVERFLLAAERLPWSAVIRGQRKIIGETGEVIDTPPWFPFEPRHYQHGMVTDLLNHTQPYLIRRSAYDRTAGWEGFADFAFAGEDCDIYLKLEEVGTIELLDEVLYYYRVHPRRASLVLTDDGALEMWRRLADKTIARIGLPLTRVSDRQPFRYQRLERLHSTIHDIDFVIAADGGNPDAPPPPVAQSLRRFGVSEDALHPSSRDPVDLGRASNRTTRPIVCFADSNLALDGPEPFETILRSMAADDVDLAAPTLVGGDGSIVFANPRFDEAGRPDGGRAAALGLDRNRAPIDAPWLCDQLMLMRREVWRAVGGFDPGYQRAHTAMVDLCLRARQRDFKCVYFGALRVTFTASDRSRNDEADLERLHRKWKAYPHLFAEAGELEPSAGSDGDPVPR